MIGRKLVKEVICNVREIHMQRNPNDNGIVEIQQHPSQEFIGQLLLQRWSPLIGNPMTFHKLIVIWDGQEYIDFQCFSYPKNELLIVRIEGFKPLPVWDFHTDVLADDIHITEVGVDCPSSVS